VGAAGASVGHFSPSSYHRGRLICTVSIRCVGSDGQPTSVWDMCLGKAEHMRVGALIRRLMLVMVMVLFIAACSSDAEPAERVSGPITIEHQLDVSARPIAGTFEVTEGADTLGCSGGTFVDGDTGNRVMTCSGPDTGTFTYTFNVVGSYAGPGDQNGPWRMGRNDVFGEADTPDATGDFIGLQGGGDWSGFGTTETITGDIE
jgi:hypothetical protein